MTKKKVRTWCVCVACWGKKGVGFRELKPIRGNVRKKKVAVFRGSAKGTKRNGRSQLVLLPTKRSVEGKSMGPTGTKEKELQ